ncbi:MAG: DUF1302 family protein [Candidatus Binatia bacterium]
MRPMWSWGWTGLQAIVACLGVVTPARGLIEYGDARISGTVYTQSALQHDGLDDWEYAQFRNLLNFNLDYKLAERGTAFGRYTVPLLDSASFYIQYRASFDPVFVIRDRYDRIIEPELRKQVQDENWIRDLYLDLVTAPVGPGRLSFRIGRQQTVWGEADVVRSFDVINPLDLRKNFLLGPDQPNLNEYRIPLWMLKVLYGWGQMGPIGNNLFEVLYIPGDIEPLRGYVGEVLNFPFDMDRRPSNQPFRRVRHPFAVTRIGPGQTDIPAQAVLPAIPGICPTGCRADLIWFNKDRPSTDTTGFVPPPKNSVPSRSWIDHAEIGARYLGQVVPFGKTVDFSLNYFNTYSDIPAAFANFPAIADSLLTSPGARDPNTGAGIVLEQRRNIGSQASIYIPAALWYPRTHIFGTTLTYSDIDLSGAIWRLEVSHQTKDPRIKPYPPFVGRREGEFTFSDFQQNFKATGRTTRMMLGADLFRSYELLDPILGAGQPFFISGQLFLEYKENISNTLGTLLDVNDRQKRWNPLYTLLVQYFFKGGQWVPLLIFIYDQDPQHFAVAPFLEYHPRNWLTIKVGQIWFTGSKYSQSSRFLHAFADRDETFVRIQYGF